MASTTTEIIGYRNANSTMKIRHADGTTEWVPMPPCTNCGSGNVTAQRFCNECSSYYPETRAEAEAEIEQDEKNAALIAAHHKAQALKDANPNPTSEQAGQIEADADHIVRAAAAKTGASTLDIVNSHFAARRDRAI